MLKLGTERHRKVLQGVDDLSAIGCFALTELGYGNNAVEMETTATWDPATKEFVVNTPSVLAQKYWITKYVCPLFHVCITDAHALQWCDSRKMGRCVIYNLLISPVVFAQLIFNGKNEGIHAFLVRIREEDMSVSKGVVIQDMGHKVD